MAAPEIPCEIRDETRAIALPRHSDDSALAEHPSGDAGGIGMRHMSVQYVYMYTCIYVHMYIKIIQIQIQIQYK